MNKIDAQTLAHNLNGLAEVFDKKPVSAKALEVWFDTLKEFQTEKVMDVLIHWPKAHPKFPTPADVWKVCNERSIDLREERARKERAENVRSDVASPEVAKLYLSKIRDILTKPKPRRTIGEREPGEDDEELAA